MIDIKLLRENPERMEENCENRNKLIDVRRILELDAHRLKLLRRAEDLRALKNEASKKIVGAKDATERANFLIEIKSFDGEADKIEKDLDVATREVDVLLKQLPNFYAADTPIGLDESGNVVLRKVGEPTKFDFKPQDHVALGKKLGLIESEKAVAVAGARFTYLLGDLAQLQYALVNFAISVLTDKVKLAEIIKKAGLLVAATPFVPVVPPLMINSVVFERMCRLEPKDERYHIPSDDLYLIGSAEHTLGPIHMDETLTEAEMPKRYFAITPAFRREAGSYGKDMRGILRLHQFDKLEMESFSLAENSVEEQNFFIAIQEYIVNSLGIPYQVVQICTGDMGGPDFRQVDIECWMPGQERYRETHTSDLMTDYQARRLNTKVKRDGKSEFVHMNDATCVAVGRLLIAIMENYQQRDGSILIPEALQSRMMGKMKIH